MCCNYLSCPFQFLFLKCSVLGFKMLTSSSWSTGELNKVFSLSSRQKHIPKTARRDIYWTNQLKPTEITPILTVKVASNDGLGFEGYPLPSFLYSNRCAKPLPSYVRPLVGISSHSWAPLTEHSSLMVTYLYHQRQLCGTRPSRKTSRIKGSKQLYNELLNLVVLSWYS